MNTHELKTWPDYFVAVLEGRKKFEARRNDRNFQVGDRLRLNEWEPADSIHSSLGEYTGRVVEVEVTHILHGSDGNKFGVVDGFCVMSINVVALEETGEQAA